MGRIPGGHILPKSFRPICTGPLSHEVCKRDGRVFQHPFMATEVRLIRAESLMHVLADDKGPGCDRTGGTGGTGRDHTAITGTAIRCAAAPT